jgi:diguanylate cyclase (GGDEF)-like protein/PAS domain S-box-containing protein
MSRVLAARRRRGRARDGPATLPGLTRLAAHACTTPIAVIRLDKPHHAHFESHFGVEQSCAHEFSFPVSEAHFSLKVPDTRTDSRLSGHPVVTGKPWVRALAGAAVVDAAGGRLGAIYVADTVAREFSSEQLSMLGEIACQVSSGLQHEQELRGLRDELAVSHSDASDLDGGVPLANPATHKMLQRWRALVHDAPVAVLVVDPADSRLPYANQYAASLCGLALASDLTGCTFADFVPPSTRPELMALLVKAPEAGETAVGGAPLQLAPVNGALRHVLVNARETTFNDRPAVQLAIHDVTAEREAHSELLASASFQQAVFAANPDAIYVMDAPTWRPMWASGKLLRALGDPTDVDYDSSLTDELVHPEDRERMETVNEASLELPDGQATLLRFRCVTPAGDYRWFNRRLTPFARDEAGSIVQLLAIERDVTDSVQAEDSLARAALHDPLTGLPNRSLLVDRLTNALQRAQRAGTEVAVLFCGLDGFKHVNEISGHAAGDGVLLATAIRLSAELRPQDTIARVSGDEFVIILEPAPRTVPNGLSVPGDLPDLRSDALAVAAGIKQALTQPIQFFEQEHVVTVSIGITFARPDEDAEGALRDADSAMYRAKALGRDRCEIFNAHLRVEAIKRGRVEQLLRAALAAKLDPRAADDPDRLPTPALWVAYQPITDLATGRICGVEALARLTDGQRIAVSPEEFIPIAEETGLIGPLGRVVLEQACRDLASWAQAIPLGVSVNLSARQAGLPGLVEQVASALRASNIAAEQLTLELTETALLEAGQSTMSALHALRDLGVKISIDDFGTGYASLRYLTLLPVTGVKVDQSFTMGLPDDPTSKAIVQSVAGLARELGLSCVVEGIETVEQLRALPEGVHGQGYLLGRPATAEETGHVLLSRGTPNYS